MIVFKINFILSFVFFSVLFFFQFGFQFCLGTPTKKFYSLLINLQHVGSTAVVTISFV